MTKNEREVRGIRARILTNSEEAQQAFADIEADIIAEWQKALWPRTRDAKWNELNGLRRLRSRLATYANAAPKN